MDHSVINERDLIFRYVAGRLSADETREFEAHFVDCPACLQQLELEQDFRAGLMSVRAAEAATATAGRAAGPRLSPRALAAAAVAVLAVATTLGYVQARRQLGAERARVTALERDYEQARARADVLARSLAAAPAPASASPAHVSVFELDTTRTAGSSTGPLLAIPPSTSLVVFSLAVGNATDYSRFSASLERADGTTVVRQDDLQSASPTSVAVAVDAHVLVAGDYSLVLEGAIRNRAPAIIARYPLRVIRR